MMIGKAIRKVAFLAVFAVLLLVVVRFWEQIVEYLFYLFGLGAVGYGVAKGTEKLQEIREQEEEIDRAVEERRQRAEVLAQEDAENQGKIEAWREKKEHWKARSRSSGGKPGGLILILCMLLVAATPAWAGEELYADLTREELIERLIAAEKLLDEADQLLARETSLKEEYKRLYLEAEEDLRAARELSRQKDEIIASQSREIELLRYQLVRSNQAWGLTGGVALTGKGVQWSLGVARKKGIISFGAGFGGGDAFSVWGEVGLWIQ